jgi:hypothetical protein
LVIIKHSSLGLIRRNAKDIKYEIENIILCFALY